MRIKQPSFTLFMPVYNDENWVLTSIESLLTQDYPHWQLIIINDGSTDKTAEKIHNLLPHPQIVYLEQENQDQLKAIENGVHKATGSHYMLLHSDDVLLPGALQRLAQHFFAHPESQGAYAPLTEIDTQGKRQGFYPFFEGRMKDYTKVVFFYHGFNLIGDHFCVSRLTFEQYCLPNYVKHGLVYALDYEQLKGLDLDCIDSWYGYRVFEENYIFSDVGAFVINRVCFRTTAKLLKKGLSVSRFWFANPLGRRLTSQVVHFNPRLFCLWSQSQGQGVNLSLALSYYQSWYQGLKRRQAHPVTLLFLKKTIHSLVSAQRRLYRKSFVFDYQGERIFAGQDDRTFFKNYQNCELPPLYDQLLHSDYDHIVVKPEHASILNQVQDFHSLFYPVVISN